MPINWDVRSEIFPFTHPVVSHRVGCHNSYPGAHGIHCGSEIVLGTWFTVSQVRFGRHNNSDVYDTILMLYFVKMILYFRNESGKEGI